jgi:hypothetical protein
LRDGVSGMPFDHRLERLKSLLAHGGPYESVRIRCVAGRKDARSLVPGEKSEGWWNLRCDIIAFPDGQAMEQVPSRRYPTTLLLEEWRAPGGLPDLILAASAGEATVDGVTVKFGPLFEDSVLVEEALPPLLFDCPTYRIVFPFAIQCPTSDKPLIADGLPFYPNGDVAAVEWCEADAFPYRRPYGTIITRLPQCRARIGKVTLLGQTLSVAVLGDRATLDGAMLKGAAWSADVAKDIERKRLDPDAPVTIELPQNPSGVELYLVDASGEVLDRHVERPGVEPWRSGVLHHTLPASAPRVEPVPQPSAPLEVASKCTIFYSWQSQLPNATNRGFIEAAVKQAAKAVRDDVTIDARPEVDRDTANKPGSPNIADTIRAKIDAAEIVVCDVSIVQGRGRLEQWAGGKHVRPTPNPNVLVELGYAMKSLGGTDRLVLVMNTAYGAIEDLPFDLRQYRPTIYELARGDDVGKIKKADIRKDLSSKLEATFRHVLALPRRRDALEFARCGNVFWLANNLVYTAYMLSRGDLPSAIREWNHAIHHAQQLPVSLEFVGRLKALRARDFVHNPTEREEVRLEFHKLWLEIGHLLQAHQPDFRERDVQLDG